VALALAGCGGEGRSDADVVRAWTDAVREGDFKAAADLFAVPATIANGGPRSRITDRRAIDFFNRSLPCAAVLLDTQESGGGYLLATFRLVAAPGGRDCRPGAGNKAQVSFRIVDGHIAEWLREATGPPPGTTET
jgi:hypothetical protein